MSGKKKGVSGTKEWSSSSANCMDGCLHDCRYCYAKTQAIRFGRKTAETWQDERVRQSVVDKNFGKRKGTIMFPTSHDITRGNVEACSTVLCKLLAADNDVLIVSKPCPEVIARLCGDLELAWTRWDHERPVRDQVLFRFTIGSMDDRTLKRWEPNAPSFAERLYSLMYCFKMDWKTSVSMEPMLDENHVDITRLVRTVAPWCTDSVWLGKMNKPGARLSMNCGGSVPEDLQLHLDALIESQGDGYIRTLYDTLKGHPKVRWKESIKKVVGLEVPTEAGLDI